MSAVAIAEAMIRVAEVYTALGAVVALGFVVSGIAHIPPHPSRVTFGARTLLFPAALVLWPLILRRWITGRASR
jgi:hypothetical protein